jgi:hypothetical protein
MHVGRAKSATVRRSRDEWQLLHAGSGGRRTGGESNRRDDQHRDEAGDGESREQAREGRLRTG